MGLSGLEPPTSRLSGVRSNRLSYKPAFVFYRFGSHLLSHIVSNAVPSAAWVLTIVFGMGTGVTPRRIATKYVVIRFRLITTKFLVAMRLGETPVLIPNTTVKT